MSSNRTNMALGQLLRVLREHEDKTYTDGQLLTRFLAQRDEEAFASLVRRHGAMVSAVCQRILGNAADVDDAFQTTFLILVKKGRSLKSRAVLGDWLHGVAKRSALKARSAAQRRRMKEQESARPEARCEKQHDDWLPILDEELSQLPEKYRLPIILCDLEGRTRQEAAIQLRWPEGTVAGRLARARELLAKRLTRRGVSLPAAGLAAMLPAATATACMAPSMAANTVKAAALLAGGRVAIEDVISTNVVSLMGEVMRAILLSKLKYVGAAIAACTLGIGVWIGVANMGKANAQVDEPGQAQKGSAKPSAVGPQQEQKELDKLIQDFVGDDVKVKSKLQLELRQLNPDIHSLLKAKRAAAKAALDYELAPVAVGRKPVDENLLTASRRLMDADLALAGTPTERLAALERHWYTVRVLEEGLALRFAAGVESAPGEILQSTKFARFEVEIEIAKERKKSAK